jgi:hypothetical protein
MGVIEQKTKDTGAWSDVQSVDNAAAMFEVGKAAIVLPSKTGKGYTRRGAGMAWSTVYKVLSESRRNKKGPKAGRDKRERIEESESSESEEEEEVQMAEDEEPLEAGGAMTEAVAPQPPKKRRSGKT